MSMMFGDQGPRELPLDILRKALRQRIMENHDFEPGTMNRRQKRKVKTRTRKRMGNIRRQHKGIDDLFPALRREFKEQYGEAMGQKGPGLGIPVRPIQKPRQGGMGFDDGSNMIPPGFNIPRRPMPPQRGINDGPNIGIPRQPFPMPGMRRPPMQMPGRGGVSIPRRPINNRPDISDGIRRLMGL